MSELSKEKRVKRRFSYVRWQDHILVAFVSSFSRYLAEKYMQITMSRNISFDQMPRECAEGYNLRLFPSRESSVVCFRILVRTPRLLVNQFLICDGGLEEDQSINRRTIDII